MSCVCALMAAVPTKAMLAARGPFWVCTWDQHWIRLLTKCCFSVSSLGVPFLKDESIQPPNHRHLLGMLRGTTGICTGWHPWPSACWWPTPLESRDNPGHLRPHQTLGTGNRGSLASTRKGVGEALLGWVALMWPLNPALGVCLGGSLSCSLGSQALLARSPGTSKGVYVPRAQPNSALALPVPFSGTCSLLIWPLVGYFSEILRKSTAFPRKHGTSACSLGVHISPSTSIGCKCLIRQFVLPCGFSSSASSPVYQPCETFSWASTSAVTLLLFELPNPVLSPVPGPRRWRPP